MEEGIDYLSQFNEIRMSDEQIDDWYVTNVQGVGRKTVLDDIADNVHQKFTQMNHWWLSILLGIKIIIISSFIIACMACCCYCGLKCKLNKYLKLNDCNTSPKAKKKVTYKDSVELDNLNLNRKNTIVTED